MQKLVFPMGTVIALVTILVIPSMSTIHIAKAYSCSSSSSTVGGTSESSGVSGTSGSCATSASSSSKTETKGGGSGTIVPGTQPNVSHVPGVLCVNPPACTILPTHGQPASGSLSVGGLQSSCSSMSASRSNVGNFDFGSKPGSLSCSSHNP